MITMRFQRQGSVMQVDLHGTSARQAEDLIKGWLNHAPAGVKELRVIHGCNRGTILKDMVRNQLSHPKIQAKLPALNPGETRLILK